MKDGRTYIWRWRFLTIEMTFGRNVRHSHLTFQQDWDAPRVSFGVALWYLFSLWVSFRVPFSSNYISLTSLMQTSVSVMEGSIHFRWWDNPNQPDRRREKWIHVYDILFGRYNVETKPLYDQRVLIYLPEGYTAATLSWETFLGGRPRLPFKDKGFGYTLKPDTPIVIPGKGENDWDMGDDAIIETSGRIDKLDADLAVKRLVDRVLQLRERYG